MENLFGAGWKVKLGAFLYAISDIFTMYGHPEHTAVAKTVGVALMGVGAAHKIEKAGNATKR